MKLTKPNVIYSGKGTPVLLLHSSMSSKLQWYKLMQSLFKTYLPIAVDFYGYGDSLFPSHLDSFCLADEVALIDSLLVDIIPPDEPLHLVGHSFGAAVALRYCYQHATHQSVPARPIRSLSLFEPVAFHLLSKTDELLIQTAEFSRVLADLVKVEPRKAAELFIDTWSGTGTFADFPIEMKEMFGQSIQMVPWDSRALMDDPLTLADYRKLTMPVLLMTGRQSLPVAHRIAELLVSHLPNCQSHLFNGGHMAPVYQANEVNRLIEGFIRKH